MNAQSTSNFLKIGDTNLLEKASSKSIEKVTLGDVQTLENVMFGRPNKLRKKRANELPKHRCNELPGR